MLVLYIPALVRIIRTSRITMARFLAVCVLMLSVTPLASIFVFFSMLFEPSPPPATSEAASMDPALHRDYATNGTVAVFEEFVMNLIKDRLSSNPRYMTASYVLPMGAKMAGSMPDIVNAMHSNHPLGGLLYSPHHTATSMFTMLLPWALSFFLGLVFPLITCIYTACTTKGGWLHTSNKRRRKNQLTRHFQSFGKKLRPSDCADCAVVATSDINSAVSGPTTHSSSNDANSERRLSSPGTAQTPNCERSCEHGPSSSSQMESANERQGDKYDNDDECDSRWFVPSPGTSLQRQQQQQQGRKQEEQSQRIIGGKCAVCLLSYREGDVITWSSNPQCVHCFHERCILSWLCRSRNRKTSPCPCCRQCYVLPSSE
mmetsp:Transcript_10948/g.30255  ORF Transcript_10948/g.30255 Transcript_10948/m.30255 type:complete len:373 (-) Transcript_10948:1180-2298(-)